MSIAAKWFTHNQTWGQALVRAFAAFELRFGIKQTNILSFGQLQPNDMKFGEKQPQDAKFFPRK